MKHAAIVPVKGRVVNLYFTSPKFTAGRLEKLDRQVVKFAGNICVAVGDAVILHPLAQLWARVRVERPEVDVFDPTDVADMVGVNADAQRLAADIPHEIQMTEIEVDAEIGIVKKYVFDTR